jgi:hypothetical protein
MLPADVLILVLLLLLLQLVWHLFPSGVLICDVVAVLLPHCWTRLPAAPRQHSQRPTSCSIGTPASAPDARGNNTAAFGAALPLQVQNNRCVCVSDVVVVVIVVVLVSVVVIVVVAAAVFDVLLFGCESRSGSDRPCEWAHAIGVGAAVILRCVRCCC